MYCIIIFKTVPLIINVKKSRVTRLPRRVPTTTFYTAKLYLLHFDGNFHFKLN